MKRKPEGALSPTNNAALKLIRDVLGLPQRDAAQLIGIPPGTLSDLELGKPKDPLERERLEHMVERWEPAPGSVEIALGAVQSIRPAELAVSPGAGLPTRLRLDLERTAAALGREVRHDLLSAAQTLLWAGARERAATVWAVLSPLPKLPADRRLVIEGSPGYATWALVERLAHESERAAARDVEAALALADLAVWTTDRLDEPVVLQAESREYAWVYLGNARRVKGWLDEADRAFDRAKELAAPNGAMPSPFSRARMLDREATLRRGEGRFGESFRLQDRAFEAANPAELGFLWLSRAALLQQNSDPEGSIEALRRACANFDEESQPRDRWGALFNLAASLLDLERGREAEALLPQIRALAELRRDTLDLLRVRWLDGKIAASTGRLEEAIAKLDSVWREFAAREISDDAALAAFDLATVYLTTNRLAETKALARQSLAVFRSLKIKREELAAVRLFWEAAERERATVEMARQAHRALIAAGAPRGNGANASHRVSLHA